MASAAVVRPQSPAVQLAGPPHSSFAVPTLSVSVTSMNWFRPSLGPCFWTYWNCVESLRGVDHTPPTSPASLVTSIFHPTFASLNSAATDSITASFRPRASLPGHERQHPAPCGFWPAAEQCEAQLRPKLLNPGAPSRWSFNCECFPLLN